MDLLPFFQWCYGTSIGEGIRNSTWLFPVIEAFHLLGLGLTAGAVLIVDLRLLGVGLNKQPPAQLWAAVKPWLLGSLTVMLVSGTMLFLYESIKCSTALPSDQDDVAVPGAVSHVHGPLPRDHDGPRRRSTAGRPTYGTHIVSPVVCVAFGGRWIGFS
jgi:hypothetical protein